jgi:serine O-acetyltransferase
VLGDITVGENARIGGGAVVVKDVPPHTTAIGIPARVVVWRNPYTGETSRREHLPDPEGELLRDLHDKLIEMELRIAELEDFTDHHVVEERRERIKLSRSIWETLEAQLGSNGNRQHQYQAFDFEEGYVHGTGI